MSLMNPFSARDLREDEAAAPPSSVMGMGLVAWARVVRMVCCLLAFLAMEVSSSGVGFLVSWAAFRVLAEAVFWRMEEGGADYLLEGGAVVLADPVGEFHETGGDEGGLIEKIVNKSEGVIALWRWGGL